MIKRNSINVNAHIFEQMTNVFWFIRCGSSMVKVEEYEQHSLRFIMDNCRLKDYPHTLYKIMYSMVKAIGYLHENNFYHLNLHPDNIFVRLATSDFRPSSMEVSGIRFTDPKLGWYSTTKYTAREGADHSEQDLYSVGSVIYEMITGILPLRNRNN